MLAMDTTSWDQDDASEPALVRVVPPCPERCGECDPCLEAVAGLHINGLLFARWLVQTGRCTEALTPREQAGASLRRYLAAARPASVPRAAVRPDR